LLQDMPKQHHAGVGERMARILHLDDNPDTRDSTRQALDAHLVDSLDPCDSAACMLRDRPPYDLALVALNVLCGQESAGARLLDRLAAGYPQTRRVVMTGWPSSADEASDIFERYPVDDIIVSGDLTPQWLRREVKTALFLDPRSVPHDVKVARSILRQQIRQSRRLLGAELRDHIERLQEYIDATFSVQGQGHRAELDIDRARTRLRRFEVAFDRLEDRVDKIASLGDAADVRAEFREAGVLY